MDYPQRQLQLIEEIEEKFKKGENPSTIVEPVKDYASDNRICLTSSVSIPFELEQKIIEEILKPLQNTDPEQYFSSHRSFHMTIQNIRTISNPPLFTPNEIEKVKSVFEKVTPKHKGFTVEIKRLFELPTSLGLCAFTSETLVELANELRIELEKAGVPDNKTYASNNVVLGNITISRYTKKPNASFYKIVNELKNIEIGKFEAKTVHLVTTNAVYHPKITKIIGQYNLR